LVVLLLIELALRIRFPWDLMLRCESSFMTTMLKLHNGQPLFGPIADANNSVASPALSYVTFAVLRPLGLDLDIRWCRLVTILAGMAAAACAASTITRLSTAERDRYGFAFAFGVAMLLIFKNFTADVPHPDNWLALHAVATLLLCGRALAKRSPALATAALMFASAGALIGLEAAPAPLGALAAVLLGNRWEWKTTMVLIVVTLVSWSAALSILLVPSDSRWVVFNLSLGRGFDVTSLWLLAYEFARGHYLILASLAIPCFVDLVARREPACRRFILIWCCVGLAEILPAVPAYLIKMVPADGLAVTALWLFLVVWACVWSAAPRDEVGTTFGVLRLTATVLLLLALVPVRFPPAQSAYEYGERLDRAVAADVRAGKRVLLARGTSPLIRAGVTSVPLDRADTVSLLWLSGSGGRLAATNERFQHHAYDRIYDIGDGYGLAAAMRAAYQPVDHWPAPDFFARNVGRPWGYVFGFDDGMQDVVVLEPR